MTPPESGAVALELERLRGVMATGIAEIKGELKAALQRTDTAEEDIRQLETRVSALERRVWTASGAAAAVGGAAGWLRRRTG
ncbi:hypothetical protein MTQ13_02980 [Streptomyces sp. XM4011]|uniref:hypothetical protein n=1 Tax=Streptomyces sp. XM4011 TaxID=2929780 RepID=UPI001FF8DFA2|nr:hypothetical protein [Streptomyces sp. XM4011]MCK1813245.1 hypothetical protein [Streptomyces sp. XM4011]